MTLDPRFLSKLSEIVELGKGRSYYFELINYEALYYNNLRRLNASIYNEENRSTVYGLFYRAYAREMAKIRIHAEEVLRDTNVDIVRSGFLYQNFGYLLQLDPNKPFFFEGRSDQFYRLFVKALMSSILRGTTKPAITDGIGIFAEGVPFRVLQPYLDSVLRRTGIIDTSGLILNPDGSVPIVNIPIDGGSNATSGSVTSYPPGTNIEGTLFIPDKSDTNIFEVRLDLENASPGSDIDFVNKGIDFFLEIMKPAHDAYRVILEIKDKFNFQAGCQPVFDLILGEFVAETFQISPGSGIFITSIDDFIVTLSDSSVLIFLDTTSILDEFDVAIPLSNLNVGDEIIYSAHESEGRYQYLSDISLVPSEIVFSSWGYLRPPLVEEVDSDFISQPVFLLYVKKVHNSQNFPSNIKLGPGAICDRTKLDVYFWDYEDFRKCGSLLEHHVTLEDVTSTYQILDQSIQLDNYPLTKGDGTGSLADISDVLVFVDSVQVSISNIDALLGKVYLEDPFIGSVIEVTYYWSTNGSYPLIHNNMGTLMNQVRNISSDLPQNYSSLFNDSESSQPARTQYKYEAYLLTDSSLMNSPQTLMNNSVFNPDSLMTDGRVVRNFEVKPSRINPLNSALGLNTTGVCLNNPTPPVPLRFSAESNIPDQWNFLEGSDLLNTLGESLNSPNTRLNSVIRRPIHNSFTKKYSFLDIETESCGGSRKLFPFCDDAALRFKFGFSDVFEDAIVPEYDCMIFNQTFPLFNEGVFCSNQKTGIISFSVFEMIEEFIDPPTEVLSFAANFILQDWYKNPPETYMIHNSFETQFVGGNPTTPIYGFPSTGELLNDPGLLLNSSGDSLNGEPVIQIGSEPSPLEFVIPPTNVMNDLNYPFFGKETFEDELISTNIGFLLEEEVPFLCGKYGLNNPMTTLNTPSVILNPSCEEVTLEVTQYYDHFIMNADYLLMNDPIMIMTEPPLTRLLDQYVLTIN